MAYLGAPGVLFVLEVVVTPELMVRWPGDTKGSSQGMKALDSQWETGRLFCRGSWDNHLFPLTLFSKVGCLGCAGVSRLTLTLGP